MTTTAGTSSTIMKTAASSSTSASGLKASAYRYATDRENSNQPRPSTRLSQERRKDRGAHTKSLMTTLLQRGAYTRTCVQPDRRCACRRALAAEVRGRDGFVPICGRAPPRSPCAGGPKPQPGAILTSGAKRKNCHGIRSTRSLFHIGDLGGTILGGPVRQRRRRDLQESRSLPPASGRTRKLREGPRRNRMASRRLCSTGWPEFAGQYLKKSHTV